MLINEVAKLCNITKKAVQYYVEEELIVPNVLENGYKDFSEQDAMLLKKIVLYRKLGLSVSDIKKIFNSGDYEYWHPGAVLLFPIVLVLVYYVYKKKVICSKKILIIFIGSVVGIVLLWFKPFIYVARNFLSFIQFPWRMMTIFTIGISIFANCSKVIP